MNHAPVIVGSDDEFLEAHVLDFKFIPSWEEDFFHAPDHRFLIVILHPSDSRQKQGGFHHLVAQSLLLDFVVFY